MMDELIAEVSQKTGLPPEQAQAAVRAVLGLLRNRLPGPLASHLEGLLGESAPAAAADASAPQADAAAAGGGLMGEAGSLLGGLFNK